MKNLKKKLHASLLEEKGGNPVEHGFMVALIAVVAIVSVELLEIKFMLHLNSSPQ